MREAWVQGKGQHLLDASPTPGGEGLTVSPSPDAWFPQHASHVRDSSPDLAPAPPDLTAAHLTEQDGEVGHGPARRRSGLKEGSRDRLREGGPEAEGAGLVGRAC